MIPSESIADATPASEFTVSFEAKGTPSEIVITAARDNTTVVIEPNAAIEGAGLNPIAVNLNAGESYMVRSQADPENPGSHDLGGTRIAANKIVGVISGNTRGSALDDATLLTGNSIRNLMIEALAPVEQHGTEFVFMPTWDSRRQQPGLPADESREFEYTRVYGSSAGTTFGTITDAQGNLDQFSVTNASFHSQQFNAPAARVIRTDQPTQAIMHPAAVVKFNGTTIGVGNAVGASYLAWSTYMVELTPREQWTNKAAFIAPAHPAGSNHYINVVARAEDRSGIYISPGNAAGTPFVFNRGAIPGTDLVWGTMAINAGLQYRIEGRNGERFAGFVYGSWRGYEQFRPGRAKGNDKEASPQAHPSEYEEAVCLYYGYPIAPRRRVLNDPDLLAVSSDNATSGVEGERRYRITISNDDAVGLRSIDLAPESVNAEFEVIGLDEEEADIVGAVQAEVRVYPIDPTQDASATLTVTDRTGNEITAPFAYSTETSAVAGESRVVGRLEIAGPNPTSGSTGIVLNMARTGNVRVTITDALGRQVAVIADRGFGPGEHTLEWDASDVPAGVYFCTVTGGGMNLVERIVVK